MSWGGKKDPQVEGGLLFEVQQAWQECVHVGSATYKLRIEWYLRDDARYVGLPLSDKQVHKGRVKSIAY